MIFFEAWMAWIPGFPHVEKKTSSPHSQLGALSKNVGVPHVWRTELEFPTDQNEENVYRDLHMPRFSRKLMFISRSGLLTFRGDRVIHYNGM
jgi:hypothetical protein